MFRKHIAGVFMEDSILVSFQFILFKDNHIVNVELDVTRLHLCKTPSDMLINK